VPRHAIALLLTTLFAGACVSTTSESAVPAAAEAAEQVRALNEQYIAAARDADTAWFAGHLDDDFIVITGVGQRNDRAAFLAAVATSPRNYASLTVRDVTVRVFGATVQVDADAPWELRDGRRGVSRYIDTYTWRDGRWKVISAQINYLPDTVGSD
jgi:ketosteroid isomerase-like protein